MDASLSKTIEENNGRGLDGEDVVDATVLGNNEQEEDVNARETAEVGEGDKDNGDGEADDMLHRGDGMYDVGDASQLQRSLLAKGDGFEDKMVPWYDGFEVRHVLSLFQVHVEYIMYICICIYIHIHILSGYTSELFYYVLPSSKMILHQNLFVCSYQVDRPCEYCLQLVTCAGLHAGPSHADWSPQFQAARRS